MSNSCIAFHAIIFDEIYPIFAASPGGVGLGFSSPDIATSLSLMGPVILVAQLILFPFLSNRFSALTTWRASAVTFAVVYPVVSLLPQLELGGHHMTQTIRWIMLLGLLTVRFVANVVAYTSIAVLVRMALPSLLIPPSQAVQISGPLTVSQLNQVAPPQNRGAVMGQVLFTSNESESFELCVLTFSPLPISLGQTAISLGRAAGPAVGGSVWSWSLKNGHLAPFGSHSLVKSWLFCTRLIVSFSSSFWSLFLL